MAEVKHTMTESTSPPPNPIEGPGKGRAFFDRAKTVAESNNYDYAIDMYIEGLNREPFNLEQHEALRDVSLRRKVKGAKARGGFGGFLSAKLPFKGKTAKEAMLNAEFSLANEPGNIPAMQTILRNAVELNYKEVVFWIGDILVMANRTNKTPKVEIYKEVAEIYGKYTEFNRASEVIQAAIELRPTDMDLIAQAKNLAAQETLQKGKYEQNLDFKESIQDQDETKKLLQEESISKSDQYKASEIEKAKADYDRNPRELQFVAKYVKSLLLMDDETHENRALEVLEKAYAETKVYRYKVTIGDIKMKQYNRTVRLLTEAVKADPEDKDFREQLASYRKERLAFELAEYHERQEHYPTDMLIQFEYGRRLYESGRYDEAIASFQSAQNNPKHRVDALFLLGRSFMFQGMKQESMETLKRAIDEYEMAETGDTKSKEMHYWLARAYEENDRTEDATNLYSMITQWDISFRDARKRLGELRKKKEDAGSKPG